MYDVYEANQIIREADSDSLMIADFIEKLVSADHHVFSPEGMRDLIAALEDMEEDSTGIFTCGGYCFLLGKLSSKCFLVDTHQVPEQCGGQQKGVIVWGNTMQQVCQWLWKRLVIANVKDEQQSFVIPTYGTDTTISDNVKMPPPPPPRPVTAKDTSSSSNTIDFIRSLHSTDNNHVESNVISSQNALITSIPPLHSTDDKHVESNDISSKIKDLRFLGQWGQYKLPFISEHREKLSDSESYKLIKSNFQRCTKVPQSCKKNAIFLINSTSLQDNEDIKSDMNGTFHRCAESKTISLDLISDENGYEALLRRKDQTKVENPLKMHVNRREHQSGLVRNIVYFSDANDKTVNETILLQYFINRKRAGDIDMVQYKCIPHGNAKTDKAFFPTRKSTINTLRERIIASENVRKLYNDSLVVKDSHTIGDKPRNMKQLYNIKASTRPTNEVESILAMDAEFDKQFIWMHSDIPYDLWVLGTNYMVADFKNAATQHPVSVDPTFNHGCYEVTPFTYRSHIFESKSKNITGSWTKTLLPGPIVIHHNKDFETYDMGFRAVATHINLKNDPFGVITDGETAIINAIKGNFHKPILGRCTNHFKGNCKKYIQDNVENITNDGLSALMDVVFGENGLIESEDKKDLQERMEEAVSLCNDIETTAVNASPWYVPRFSLYVKEHEKTVLRKMIRDVRRSMKMPINSNGAPSRIYTNQSETQNSMLLAKKLSLGYTKKKDVPISIFIRDIWLAMIDEIDNELCKAAFNQSDRYRLSPKAKYLEIDPAVWQSMNKLEQQEYMKNLRSLSQTDIDAKIGISCPSIDDRNIEVVSNLSVCMSTAIPNLFHAKVIEKKALALINSANGITTNPSLTPEDDIKCFLVAGRAKKVYTVKISQRKTISCTCQGYHHVHICSHTVAVAEKQKMLPIFIDKVKKSKVFSRSANPPNGDKGAGRKGKVQRRHREYESNPPNVDTQVKAPFTEVWHNNFPLEVCNVKEIPSNIVCWQCRK